MIYGAEVTKKSNRVFIIAFLQQMYRYLMHCLIYIAKKFFGGNLHTTCIGNKT